MQANLITENQLKLLAILTSNGFRVLRITENEMQNVYSWWVLDEFTPFNQNVIEAPFHMVVGHDVTPLMNQVWTNETQAINRFKQFLDDQPVLTMKFSTDFKWKEYVARTRQKLS